MTSRGAITCSVPHHIRRIARRSQSWRSTDLSHREDGLGDLLDVAVGAPWQSNEQNHAHSEEGTRLDEHDDDGFVQSADSTLLYYGANAPGVQDEPDHDHECEEDVE